MLKAIQSYIKPQTPVNTKDKPKDKKEDLKEWFVITIPLNKLPQENYSQTKKS